MLAALGFLTIIGRGDTPNRRTARWFPLVGLLVGAVVGGVWWSADRVFPPLAAAGLVIAADLLLTGMLHLDGLVDSADGLLPHLSRERRLEVLADVGTGAFGLGVAVTVLLLRFSALASRPVSILLIAGLWAVSRSVVVLVMAAMRYARPGGLADSLSGDRSSIALGLAGIAAGAGLTGIGDGRAGLAAVVAALTAAAGVSALARRRIGGFTGDVLGAVILIAETAGLIVAAARW